MNYIKAISTKEGIIEPFALPLKKRKSLCLSPADKLKKPSMNLGPPTRFPFWAIVRCPIRKLLDFQNWVNKNIYKPTCRESWNRCHSPTKDNETNALWNVSFNLLKEYKLIENSYFYITILAIMERIYKFLTTTHLYASYLSSLVTNTDYDRCL